MTVPPKWLLGLFILWLGSIMMCGVVVGAPLLGVGETDVFNPLVNPPSDIDGATKIYYIVTAMLGFGSESASELGINLSFFDDGIGYWIRVFILTISAAIALPLAYDTLRLISPWKR